MDGSILAYKRAIALQKITALTTQLADATGVDAKQAPAFRALGERAREMFPEPKDNLRALRVIEATADLLEALAAEIPVLADPDRAPE